MTELAGVREGVEEDGLGRSGTARSMRSLLVEALRRSIADGDVAWVREVPAVSTGIVSL